VRVTQKDAYTEHTARLELDDVGSDNDLPARLRQEGSVFRPKRAIVRWLLNRQTMSWELIDIAVTGGVVKKDGTARDDFNGQVTQRWSRDLREAPSWVQTLVNLSRPNGVVAVMSLRGTVVHGAAE
jgi:hypothetical protein